MKKIDLFSESDLEQIRQAVIEEEKTISGEIVPYFTDRSDHYPESIWRSAVFGSLLGAIAVVAVDHWTTLFLFSRPAEVLGIIVLAGFLSALAIRPLPSVRRRLIGQEVLRSRVEQMAETAFLRERVYATAQRSGILIMLSSFERRVRIIADEGIAARVPQAEWDALARELIAGIRQGKPAEALIAAIRKCGALLRQNGFLVSTDDRNELSDALRVKAK